MIFIKTDDAQRALQRAGAVLSERELAMAIARAINRSLERGRTLARKEIKKVYNIPQKYLAGIDYKRASATLPVGKLFASRKPIPLDAFSPRQEMAATSISISKKGKQNVKQFKRLKSNPTAGVSIEVKRGQKEVIPYAFLIPGGAVRVFARGEYKKGTDHGFVVRHVRVNSSGNDTPVKPLITVSEFGSILNPSVINNIGREIKVLYPQRLAHEITYLAQKAAMSAGSV
jgi:hypothetical protein